MSVCPECGNPIPRWAHGICSTCERNERDYRRYGRRQPGGESGMGKYDPLGRFLEATPAGILAYTFSFFQIEQILGDNLPTSARKYREWWANERSPGGHVQSQSWLSASWEVESVSLESEWVRFHRSK